MADKPILFSGPMVRALLAGTKTQTRRAISPSSGDVTPSNPLDFQPRYLVGDRLYVREHRRVAPLHDDVRAGEVQWHVPVHYVADGSKTNSLPILNAMGGRFRQGMHMPRWASRLTLTVTDVRIERLQDCSRDDAMAEGIVQTWGDFNGDPPEWAVASINQHGDASGPHIYDNRTSVENYRELWNHINGPGSWDANPWVAACTFTVEHGNIDTLAKAA